MSLLGKNESIKATQFLLKSSENCHLICWKPQSQKKSDPGRRNCSGAVISI